MRTPDHTAPDVPTGADAPPRRRPVRRKVAFACLVFFGFFVVLEVALGVVGVRPLAASHDPVAGFGGAPLFERATCQDGRACYRTTAPRSTHFNIQRFAADKGDGTFRIFVVGGSSVYGRPFFDETSVCGFLRAMLGEIDAGQTWEVVNVGGISYASHRLVPIVEELCAYTPDLVVFYTGHNEFLERTTYRELMDQPAWLTQTVAVLSYLRTTALIDRATRLVAGGRENTHATADGPDLIPIDAVGTDAYRRDADRHRQTIERFGAHLGSMVRRVQDAGGRVMLVAPASNLRDFAPFKSEHRPDLSEAAQREWSGHAMRGLAAMQSGKLDEARAAFAQAEAIDPYHAGLLYATGQALLQSGERDAARAYFERARDEDICPLRAGSDVIEVVRDTARSHDTLFIDLGAVLARMATANIPGRDAFYDHVHMTLEANEEMAAAICAAMKRAALLPETAATDHDLRQRVRSAVEGRIEPDRYGLELAQLARLLERLGQLKPAIRAVGEAATWRPADAALLGMLGSLQQRDGQATEAVQTLARAVEMAPRDAGVINELGIALAQAGRNDEAVQAFERALAVQPNSVAAHEYLGVLAARSGDVAAAIEHFGKVVELTPDAAEGHNNLGLALANAGRIEEAIGSYHRALNLRPGFGSASYNLGLALEQVGRLSEAESAYRSVLRTNPTHSGAGTGLMRIQDKLGRN